MVRTRYIIIAALVVTIGIAASVSFFESEEKKVRKQFSSLAQWASKERGENTFTMALKIQNLGSLFAEDCALRSHINSISGSYTRQEITSLAGRGRLQFSQLSVRFHDHQIEFPEKDLARVLVTGQLSGTLKGEDIVDDTLELEVGLKKFQDKWLFTAFEVVEVLEK